MHKETKSVIDELTKDCSDLVTKVIRKQLAAVLEEFENQCRPRVRLEGYLRCIHANIVNDPGDDPVALIRVIHRSVQDALSELPPDKRERVYYPVLRAKHL